MSDLIKRAVFFASDAHKGQVRKYTGEAYFWHCHQVAVIIREHNAGDEEVQAAAYLHDVVEDTPATEEMIRDCFNDRIAKLVMEVTNVSKPEDGNRAMRKGLDRGHLARASADGKTIKLADIISNCGSIIEHDPSFAAVYLKEKQELMPFLTEGHSELYWLAQHIIEEGLNTATRDSPSET